MIGVLNAVLLVLSVMFIAYVLCILVPFLRHKPITPGDTSEFEWHLFIPCRDEETVVDETIRRAMTDFPEAHVWVIDDDSDDRTAQIADEYAATNDHVHVVRRIRPNARLGKGSALNSAYAALNEWLAADTDRSRVIIGVVDADGELDPAALRTVASSTVFGRAETGAAQIAVWMKNRGDTHPLPDKGRVANWFASSLLRLQDIEFRTVIAGMQSLRSKTGTVGLGGNGQFARLSTLDKIGEQYGEPWHGALLEDYELGVHVLLAGYEVKHVYDTHVSQEALPSLKRLMVQRTRWAQGNIQCVKYIKDVAASPYFDSVGVIETAYYLFLPFAQVIGLTAFVTATALTVPKYIADPASLQITPNLLLSLFGLMLAFSITPFGMWGVIYKYRCEPSASLAQGIRWGLGMWLYVYYTYICIIYAFIRIIRRRNGWAKTRRNAEITAPAGASIAIEH
jgi:1,2-diacylglycerol 3-beta-glucosyltransferase